MNFTIPKEVNEGNYQVIAYIRTNAPNNGNFYFNLGTWDAKNKIQKYKSVPCDKISGRKYIAYNLGDFYLKENLLFFFGGIARKTAGNKKFADPDIQIYCEKVEFVKSLNAK
jgi:hypothetical protein